MIVYPYLSAFVSSLSSVFIPKTTSEALSHPSWCQVMLEEIDTLTLNGTWDLVPLRLGKTYVGLSMIIHSQSGS